MLCAICTGVAIGRDFTPFGAAETDELGAAMI